MIYDVIVIGAGVNGSSTAYHLIKEEDVNNVLLLEQFPTPHTQGSSHGQTRVFRCFYYDEILGQLSRDSFALWKELESEVKEELLVQNGYLEVYDPAQEVDNNQSRQGIETLQSLGEEYQILSGVEINKRFPPLNFPPSWRGIYEPGGGTVLASKCVVALQRAFVARGGTFLDREKVWRIIPNRTAKGNTVTVHTAKHTYEARSIVIAAGRFTTELTETLGLKLPLEVKRVHPYYWDCNAEYPDIGTVQSGFPSWFSHLVYGLPVLEYPGMMKICGHWGRGMKEDVTSVSTAYLKPIQNFIEKYMKNVSATPSVVEECFYTVTPDNFFILDVHPVHTNIVIGAGFSGGGFKMAPVTGKILGDLALGKKVAYDLSFFRLARFDDVIRKISSKL